MAQGSITTWLHLLKREHQDAAQRLWDRYFERLVSYARTRLRGASRNVEDEEDVAVASFTTFCGALNSGRMDEVQNRDDLWRTLALIAAGKSVDLRRRQSAKKRGQPAVEASALDKDNLDFVSLEQVVGTELDPSLAAEMTEEFDQLLQMLPDRLKSIAIWKLDGHLNQEVAEMLGCSVRSVARELALIRQIWSSRLPGI